MENFYAEYRHTVNFLPDSTSAAWDRNFGPITNPACFKYVIKTSEILFFISPSLIIDYLFLVPSIQIVHKVLGTGIVWFDIFNYEISTWWKHPTQPQIILRNQWTLVRGKNFWIQCENWNGPNCCLTADLLIGGIICQQCAFCFQAKFQMVHFYVA